MFIQNTNAGHKDVRFTQGSSISDKSCPKRNNSYTKLVVTSIVVSLMYISSYSVYVYHH